MAFPAKLADLDDDNALSEIAAGTFLKHIAARYGVAKQSLHERLSKHPAWRTAVAMQAETLVESATSEAMGLGDGATMPDIARARVKVDTAHKWASARDPANWAQRTHMTIETGPGDLDERIRRAMAAERAVIDGQAREVPDTPKIEEKP